MERRADEPEQLEDLFRIDHLTTRMRRHAEGLIILSGDSPGRSWSQPVPFIDVLRAAVAEVEDYTRIQVEVRTNAALAGNAVADVVHMLAELVENATVFSPPNTQVRVQGELVGRGFAVEIEDRGLGLSEERLAEINRDLAQVPDFDLAGSDRLGLFITGRLAQRHDIMVTLRSSVYGGTTAIVIIPMDLVVPDESHTGPLAVAGHELELAGQPALTNGHGHTSIASGRTSSDGQHYAGNGQHHVDNGHRASADGGSTLDAPAEPWTPRHSADRPSDDSGWFARPSGFGAQPAEPVQPAYPADPPNGGLPVRVRQASLAPQLRDQEAAYGGAAFEAPASADAARSTMSALQRGWERGRSATEGPSDSSDAGTMPADER
jgi:anti-sigma regulatory factor (Ser/Thr protein kinase)